jgi:hypothetical protein
MLLRTFQGEALNQCRFAALASQDLDAALKAMDTPRIWMALQQILVSTANLSKLLWGSSDADEESRAPLRESLEVTGDSPIRSKRLRNAFEHFDEWIDTWWKKDSRHIYISRNIGPAGMIQMGDSSREQERLGHFDPETGKVTLWDREADLNLILGEIGRILPLAERATNR